MKGIHFSTSRIKMPNLIIPPMNKLLGSSSIVRLFIQIFAIFGKKSDASYSQIKVFGKFLKILLLKLHYLIIVRLCRLLMNREGPPVEDAIHYTLINNNTGHLNAISMSNPLLLVKLKIFMSTLGQLLFSQNMPLLREKTSLLKLSPFTTGGQEVAPRRSKFNLFLGINLFLIVGLLFLSSTSFAQVDLSLSKNIDKGQPSIGETVTYTVTVKNSGILEATGVTVKDSLPMGGVSYLSHSLIRGGIGFNAATKIWNVGTVAPGDSAILEIEALVLAQGVFFNVAEIMTMDQDDSDSWPGDGALDQDDLASTCFSVPIEWYVGDEFTVSVPTGYKGIQWFYNGIAITDSIIVGGLTVAVVNLDSTLTIKGPGSYTFTSTVGVSCPATGCCAIQIVPGPLGSIGDFVWFDTDKDGIQDPLEEGVSGVTVQLLDSAGNLLATTVTGPLGKYLFDSLPSGKYRVKFLAPTGNVFTLSNAGDDTQDSDAGLDGLTHLITIDTSKLPSDTLRNNPHIDAGLIPTPVFDLALAKTLAPGQVSNVNPGALVNFRLTVTNQGNVAATQIALTDSLPAGMTLQDTDWTASGSIATLNVPIAGPLAPGASTFVDITVKVSESFTNGTLTNYAQIQDAKDSAGNPVTDIDSEPGNGFTNGEDDDDSEPVFVSPTPVFDLALAKTLAPGQVSNVNPGALVNFRLTVTNQGNVAATQIALTDSLLAGMTLQDTDWTASGNIATLNVPIAGPLAPGASTFVDITVKVSESFTNGTLTNYAQIQDAKDGAGNPVTDIDSEPGNGFTNGEDDDDSEPVFVSPTPVFDLALAKTLAPGQVSNVNPGALVTFRLTVTNQGNVAATQIALTDSLPAGMTLQDTDWTASGSIATLNVPIAGPLAPGASTFVDITVKVSESFTNGTLTNYAQIQDAKDGAGNPVTDIDSEPGSGFNDGEDDDDSEPVNVSPTPVFDLAIAKTLAPGQVSNVNPGAAVTFRLTVTNEGNVAATQIALTDSLPAGMTLQDTDWTASGNIATLNVPIAGPLAPGASTFVDITVKVSESFTNGTLTNYAQIQDAKDGAGNPVTDIDSEPGSGFNDGEDDDDSEPVNVSPTPVFDLAIAKTLAPGQVSNVNPGALVNFRLTVTNEGNVSATQIALTDSLPTGMTLQDTDWTASGNIATLNVPIAGPLAPGASTFVDITVKVSESFTNGTLTNYAQIQDAKDGDGNPVTDIDSEPGSGFNDGEDDDDSEPVNVSPTPVFDLAIAKTLAPGQVSNVNPGALVTFRLTVTNQGNVAATQIALTDSLPTGMTLQDTDWTASGNIATLNVPIAGPLAPGASTFVDITVKVSESFTNGTLTNYAQIQDAKDGDGNPVTDIDSEPGSGFNDGEDDDDSESITVDCPTIALTVSPDEEICVGESVLLGASTTATGITINWYYAAIGGTPFVTTTSGQNLTLSPTSTVTYYLEAVSATGCKSPRTPITVIVNAKPATPTCVGNVQNTCPATTVDLTAITISPISIVGGVFEWRTGASPTSALVTNPTQVNAGTYYLFEKSPAGCYSNPMVVSVNIIPCDCQLVYSVNAGADQEVCAGLPVSISAAVTGVATSVTWTSTGSGTFANSNALTTTYTPSIADIAAGNVILTATTNDPDAQGICVPKSDAVAITINPQPAPAFGVACDDTLVCLGKSTKLIGFAPGSTIKWYLTASGGTAIGTTLSGGKLTVTPTGTTTYYAETISDKGCISAERTPVTVIVQPCFSDLEVVKTILTPGPYSPGQSVNYAITVKNLGVGNATNVKVTEVFPAALTYVSAVPAGEYNNATGIWTIGNLTANSNRTLVIAATIKANATGSITNTAIVSSPDNDPGNTSNDTSSVTIEVIPVADLSLIKKASKLNAVVGETITYTLEVTNEGPQTATNVEVLDQLPAGLEFVASADFSKTGNILKGSIASIMAGQTKSLTFTAKLTGTGSVKNIAQISKSDQSDPDSSPGNGYNNGEDDEASVTVNVGCPTIEPPLIACATTNICVGASVTLTSIGCKDGTVKWSNGMEGASITITLNQTTTFTAVCDKGECESAASNPITINVANPVTPTLTSNVSSLCVGGSATLTASNCNGVLTWSTGATGSPLVVSPVATTTYTATCTKNGCVSPVASITINVTQPGPAPLVTCGKMEICPGESVTLEAHECEGVVQWSNGITGNSITVSPMTTTSYTAKCVNGTCVSEESELHTITVTTPVAPIIATNKLTICPGGSAILTASGCDGNVSWSNGMTGSSITVTLNATRSFTAICKTDACESGESNVVTVNVVAPNAPIIASNKTVICSGDAVQLTSTGCSGTVTWSNGMTGVSITVSPNATTSYTATCGVDACVSGSSNTVTINVNTSGQAPVIAAGKSTVCSGEEVTLTATGCIGMVQWSNGQEGASIKVTPTATSSYTAICKATSSTCASGASNTVVITVSPLTPPTLTSSKASICVGESVTLTATQCAGTVKWSNGMSGASINVTPAATTTYTATCESGVCVSASASVTVTVTSVPAPTVICTADTICKGESLTLFIENCAGTALWSTGETADAIVVSPMVTTSYTARCVVNGCTSPVSGNYTITVVQPVKPVLTASANPINKGESTTITATGCNGSVIWSNGALGTSITMSPIATTTYSAVCMVKECSSDTAKITITVNECIVAEPSISASTPTVCLGGNVTLTATGCNETVVWSNGQTGTSITVALNSSTTFTATCKKSETCISTPSNAVTVSVISLSAPTVTASSKTICTGDTVKLTAYGCEGNITWSNGQTGASIYVNPTATASYTATCSLGSCVSQPSVACIISVGKPTAPSIQISANTVCFGESVTLTASGCNGNGYVIWSNGLVGNSITITPASTSTFTAQCCTSTNCKSDLSNAVSVTVAPKVIKPLTQNLTNTCPFTTVDLSTGITSSVKSAGGVFVFRTGNTPQSPVVANPAAAGAGTYYVFEQTATGCFSEPSVIIVTILNCNDATPCETNPATASAGQDAKICAAISYKLTGSIAGSATSAVWTTSGTGTFDNPATLGATYYPSLQDLINGEVILTLTTNDPDGTGPCQSASDQMKLTIESINFRPNIAINGVVKQDTLPTYLTICAGDSVVLTATDLVDANGAAYTYKWNEGNSTPSNRFVVRESGSYMVKLVNANTCCSINSARVVVTVAAPISTPVVSNKRNTCPAITVDLSTAILGNPSQGGQYIYRIGTSPLSDEVASPQAVGAGTYYVFEKSAAGCFSAPAKVDVSIFDCAIDTVKADLAIYKTVDKATVQVGGEVTYSIKVKNNGPKAATNISVIDILPEGLEYVAGVGYSIEGNVIKGTIPALAPGDSVVYSCAVKVTGTGSILNVARIANLDQVDSNLANNESSVGIVSTQAPQTSDSLGLGVALALTNVEPSTDNSFILTYKISLKNYGNGELTNVQVYDSLWNAFPSPSEFQVLGSGEVSSGSSLVVDPTFNGKTQIKLLNSASTLGAKQQQTITLFVRVMPNGNMGPFYSSVSASGTSGDSTITDFSNNGFDTTPSKNEPTPVRFDQPNSIGIAKLAGTPVEIENGVYDVPYTIMVKNLGLNDLTKVQVVDDLSQTFGNGAIIVPGSISLTADTGFTVDTAYTGQGEFVNLLVDSLSTLPKGETRDIKLTVRIDINSASTTTFNNIAFGSALGAGGVMVSDTSTSGSNPDPNNDLDPGNDSEPTPIVLNNVPGQPRIGIALSVKDTTRQSDGSYHITYMAIVKNFGSTVLTDVQVTDSLSKVFNTQTGATFRKIGTPIASDLSELAINPDFDGVNDFELLISSNSRLNAGASDTLTFTISVATDGRETPYLNQAYAFAKSGEIVVSDISTNGLLPDINGNNDPTEELESEPTPIVIPGGDQIFIPEGFSPNGDGINDYFVIRYAGGQKVSLEIYNRWMNLVYKNNDYQNDWDGTTNNGLRVGSTTQGLPDGTYFYVVKLENGRQYVRFLTITR
ncbi:DUF7507 domain-containing protein [Arundinibacter roseus]|uniref:DUF11 domain-containing protein n=1 Tax=Arundinibacter roseus TaxID=2070510 RepID=A0A4R4KBJ5_9BACT|nr:SdrD B-like domain-containing protein [Arundinibacter roseus]TDB65254.1 DUF11 domain-containing protein [Arundinibacter roseus]